MGLTSVPVSTSNTSWSEQFQKTIVSGGKSFTVQKIRAKGIGSSGTLNSTPGAFSKTGSFNTSASVIAALQVIGTTLVSDSPAGKLISAGETLWDIYSAGANGLSSTTIVNSVNASYLMSYHATVDFYFVQCPSVNSYVNLTYAVTGATLQYQVTHEIFPQTSGALTKTLFPTVVRTITSNLSDLNADNSQLAIDAYNSGYQKGKACSSLTCYGLNKAQITSFPSYMFTGMGQIF